MSSKRPTRRLHHREETVHLNITPFIDVLVCLILFLLVSAAVLKLSVVDTQLPKLSDVATLESQLEPEDKLVVSVQIRQSGFIVGRVGQDKSGSKQRRWGSGGDLQAKIPRLTPQKWDFPALNRHMQKIKAVYPDAVSVLILPEDEISYENLVAAMDATRDYTPPGGKRMLLFPDAVVGQLAESGGMAAAPDPSKQNKEGT